MMPPASREALAVADRQHRQRLDRAQSARGPSHSASAMNSRWQARHVALSCGRADFEPVAADLLSADRLDQRGGDLVRRRRRRRRWGAGGQRRPLGELGEVEEDAAFTATSSSRCHPGGRRAGAGWRKKGRSQGVARDDAPRPTNTHGGPHRNVQRGPTPAMHGTGVVRSGETGLPPNSANAPGTSAGRFHSFRLAVITDPSPRGFFVRACRR